MLLVLPLHAWNFQEVKNKNNSENVKMKAFIRSIKIILLKVFLIQEEEAYTLLRKFDMSFFFF